MSIKMLKPRSSVHRPSPEEILQVAAQAAPGLPPAQVHASDRATTLNLRVRESTVKAITVEAQAKGMTLKQVVCQALASVGVKIAPLDLEDGTPRRGQPRRK
jgi:hypothetical protein